MPPEGDDDAGVLFGTWTAGGQSTQQFLDAFFRGGPTAAPALLFDSTVGNSAAGLTGLEFKLRGPNVTVSHKEASGLAALVGAVDLLREGRASALIAGGVDALFETFYKAHDRFKVMSAEAERSRRLAPFDAERAGFVMGEGAFAFWVEPDAAHRTPRGAILGVAASSAAVPVNAWPDRPAPLARTMRLALEDAGVSPGEVDVVYASANATSLDAVEARAIADVFAGASPVVTSVKGALGESGASGSAACAAALLCGAAGTVPPIAGLIEPDASAAASCDWRASRWRRRVRSRSSTASPAAAPSSAWSYAPNRVRYHDGLVDHHLERTLPSGPVGLCRTRSEGWRPVTKRRWRDCPVESHVHMAR